METVLFMIQNGMVVCMTWLAVFVIVALPALLWVRVKRDLVERGILTGRPGPFTFLELAGIAIGLGLMGAGLYFVLFDQQRGALIISAAGASLVAVILFSAKKPSRESHHGHKGDDIIIPEVPHLRKNGLVIQKDGRGGHIMMDKYCDCERELEWLPLDGDDDRSCFWGCRFCEQKKREAVRVRHSLGKTGGILH